MNLLDIYANRILDLFLSKFGGIEDLPQHQNHYIDEEENEHDEKQVMITDDLQIEERQYLIIRDTFHIINTL